jgi:hypothetical protein
MESERDELKFEVRRKVDFLLGDCRTFSAVRTDQFKWFTADASLGGGNFLMALGLMSLLGVLAKVHLWLIDPESFSTAADREEAKRAMTRIADVLPEMKPALKKLQSPRPGDCNEQRAFTKFIEAMKGEVNLGIANNVESEEVWRKIRNNLTHMAAPDGGIAVYQGENQREKVELLIRSAQLAFTKKEDGRWICLPDRLALDMQVVADWLLTRIDECKDIDRIKRSLKWIRGEKE